MVKQPYAIEFPQANVKMAGDAGTTQPLPACCANGTTLTCWAVPFWVRLKILFGAKLWVWTISPTPPCMSIDTSDPFAPEKK